MNIPSIPDFSETDFGALDAEPDLSPGPVRVARELDASAKAAVIVRLLLTEGEDVPIDALPPDLQAKLTAKMGGMGLIDKTTLDSVVSEFTDALEGIGLSFPRGLASAVETMDGKISPETASRLRKEAGVRDGGDPWDRLRNLKTEELAAMAEAESVEVAAVLLSKLDTRKAADLLTALPGPLARRLTYAVSLTGKVTPAAVDRIGLSLAAQLDQKPDLAFEVVPEERISAILNQSTAATRDEMLDALEETDKALAEQVRKSIFLFEHIPDRVKNGDIPAILRVVETPVLVTALAAAKTEKDLVTAEFILSNISKRMADGIREEMGERGAVKQADGENAMNAVVAGIRTLEQNGEIAYREPEDEDGS